MEERTTRVGLDVHKKMINVALLRPGTRNPVTWDVPNEPEAVRRFTRKLARLTDGPVACCYEAGPCGYVLQRQLESRRVACQVRPVALPVIRALPAESRSACPKQAGKTTPVRAFRKRLY